MYGSLLLVCLSLPTQAADRPSSPAPDEVANVVPAEQTAQFDAEQLAVETKRYVRQLNANSAAERDAAEAALVKLGPEVLGHLPPVNRFTPAEVKERLGRVRSVLETKVAKAAAEPTRVTLKGQMSLAEALESLEQQTGNRIAKYRQRSGTVTVDFDQVLYWQALDEILDQAGLSIEEYGGVPNTLVLRARGDGERDRAGSASYSGVFRFEPIRLESRRDLRNPDVNGLRLTVSITWEPRVKPISLRHALDTLELVDDQGNPLSVDSQRMAMNASAESGVSAIEMALPLVLPPRGVNKIASLTGQITAMVPGSVQTFSFDELEGARDVEQRNAGVTVTLEQVRKNVDLYDIFVRVTYDDASNALESHRAWIFNNDAYLIDAQGQKIANIGLRGTRAGRNEAGVALLFDVKGGLEGCQFVYKTPALILNLPVDYQLKGIDLP